MKTVRLLLLGESVHLLTRRCRDMFSWYNLRSWGKPYGAHNGHSRSEI